jgi:hypothetical protein
MAMTCIKKHARWKDISVTVARQGTPGRKVRLLVCADNHQKKDRNYFGGSSSGRIADFEFAHLGSNPSPPAKNLCDRCQVA